MKLQNLHDLLLEDLKDLYDAENQITKALPKVINTVSSPDLKTAFEKHLSQTENHIKRLEQVFQAMGKPAARKPCKAMQGIIQESDEVINQDATSDVRDAALLASAQKVEHYEIASYGTLATYAKLLGEKQVVDLLVQTLNEEKKTDEHLTLIAETHLNLEAAS